jgi:hypothetical protein
MMEMENSESSECPLVRRTHEEEEKYLARVRPILPNFPDDAIIHWLYRHNPQVLREYKWINFPSLSFRLETWSTERILAEVRHTNEPGVEIERRKLLQDRGDHQKLSRLAAYIVSNGTWPTPPLVIDNDRGARWPNGSPIARFQAIEGMHRLGFLRALSQGSPELAVARANHTLWLITL